MVLTPFCSFCSSRIYVFLFVSFINSKLLKPKGYMCVWRGLSLPCPLVRAAVRNSVHNYFQMPPCVLMLETRIGQAGEGPPAERRRQRLDWSQVSFERAERVCGVWLNLADGPCGGGRGGGAEKQLCEKWGLTPKVLGKGRGGGRTLLAEGIASAEKAPKGH